MTTNSKIPDNPAQEQATGSGNDDSGQIEKGSGYGEPNAGSGETVTKGEEDAEAGVDYSGTGDYSGPITADEED